MARPGIMIYFDMLDPIRVLPDEDKGRLLVAMLEYGLDGTMPVFDGMLALAWGFVKPKLDRDSLEYARTVQKRQYAAFCRNLKRKGLPELSFDVWTMLPDDERDQMISGDITWYPTTTSTATGTTTGTPTSTGTITETPTTTSTATSTAAAAGTDDFTAAAADRKMKFIHGELGRGVVILTEFQLDTLLNKLGIDGFDYYVNKLSGFILDKGTTVKNHYATILRWWMEDTQNESL